MSGNTRRRLTPDERDRIIEMRLNRVPVRKVAELIGCQSKTVQLTWKKWLAETAAERAEALEETREELIQRMEQIATDARVGAQTANSVADQSAEVRFLAEERAALREIARLTGSDAPVKIEHTGEVAIAASPIERLTAALDKLLPAEEG